VSQTAPSPGERRRYSVVGTSGSGKTTLAADLARRLGIPHVELDALHWGPDWSHAPSEVMRERITAGLSGDAWVIDGNYSEFRDIVWGRANTVVWLDYRRARIMWRVIWRTLRRTVTREELWSGNRERFWTAFFSRESIILYAFQTYGIKRKQFPRDLAKPQYAHLELIRLQSPHAAQAWLDRITPRRARVS
jgi:adenylate kinase family enzyme